MYRQVRLHTPIEVTGADLERALAEQCKDEPAVARVFERLRGTAAERAAEELNRALDVDVFDLLARAWIQLPAVHRAVQFSALTREPSTLVNVDGHRIASTSRVVLDTSVAANALPPLELTLEIVADVHDVTIAARDGRIDLIALGQTSVLARLEYRSMLVAERSTGISGVSHDPFTPRSSASDRPASVDFPI